MSHPSFHLPKPGIFFNATHMHKKGSNDCRHDPCRHASCCLSFSHVICMKPEEWLLLFRVLRGGGAQVIRHVQVSSVIVSFTSTYLGHVKHTSTSRVFGYFNHAVCGNVRVLCHVWACILGVCDSQPVSLCLTDFWYLCLYTMLHCPFAHFVAFTEPAHKP